MNASIRLSSRILAGFVAVTLAVPVTFADSKEKNPDEIGNRDVGKGVNFVVAEYVNRIGQNLVRNSDAKVPFTVKVIDSEEINAFALPGGFFVNTGILLNADNEAEMAGVMAHEIGHVAARHGTRQAMRGEIAQIGSIVPLIAVGGMAGYGIYQAMGLVVPMGFLKFSRNFEAEADMLGIEYMYKAGYDPTAFVDFFEKVQSQEKRKPGTMSKLFSSHPPTEDRIKHSQEIIQKDLKAKPEYVVSTSEFNDVKARTMAMHNRRKVDDPKDAGRPTLRRNPNGQVDASGDEKTPAPDQDDRPTLKRRDDI
jgi:predicted Zn-dependent protease